MSIYVRIIKEDQKRKIVNACIFNMCLYWSAIMENIKYYGLIFLQLGFIFYALGALIRIVDYKFGSSSVLKPA